MDTRPPRAAAVPLWRYPGWATYHERLPPQRRYKKQLPAYRLFIASVFRCHRCGRNDSTLLRAMQRFCLGSIVDNFVICFWPFVFENFCASDLLIYAPAFIFFLRWSSNKNHLSIYTNWAVATIPVHIINATDFDFFSASYYILFAEKELRI